MDTDEQPEWIPGRQARFLPEDTEPRQLVENGICDTLMRSTAVSFCVDSQNRLHEVAAIPEISACYWPSTEWVSMRELLETQRSNNFAGTCDEAMMLGLTLACSFLQLYSTQWVSDSWNSANVKFRRNTPLQSSDLAYISMILEDQSSATVQSAVRVRVPGVERALVVLATLLFELGTNKAIEQYREPEDSSNVLTMRRCIRQLKGQPPCFIEAVEYCLDFHKELEPDSKANILKIAAGVISPFERDLRSSAMAPPSSGYV